MGNCLTSGTSSTSNDSREGRSNGGPPRSKKKKKIPREEHLHLVPGRMFSNEGRSRISSIHTQQGRKGINQDAMILWEGFGGDGGVLCGVFDGHGPHGHLVARKVRDALPLKLLSALPKHGRAQLSVTAWRRAFLKAYKAMDKDLRSHPALDCFCSGSTAVTILKLDSILYMGHVGDSRAVLASKDDGTGDMVAVQLTVDLKPDLPREAERIKRCRGRVFALQDEPEVPRVWLPFDDAPGLAMARAFGDFCLKDYGVISVPEFFHWTLTDQDQFVILASDGVWDVLSNKEAVDIVSSSPTRSAAAKLLVEAAAREWKLKYPTSKMDDCAVVCLFLDGKADPETDSAEINSFTMDNCSHGSPATESIEGHNQEPTLNRNFTVRSGENSRMQVLVEEGGTDGVAEDQNWSGLEGVTRVNSLVQLPRFSEERVAA
uniref:protein-serine/threonine phosphatase n=1 Tax=Ananas comosus var. bracteatus TaxID=296719 RepID=A0A6V7NLX5_ANACO|nr:unnamed protein product [Ananas comosus var. bracteatus]